MKEYHLKGYKAKKIAEIMGVTEQFALEQMNSYLHNLYPPSQKQA